MVLPMCRALLHLFSPLPQAFLTSWAPSAPRVLQAFLTSWAPSAPKVLAVATGSLRGPGSRVGEFAVIALAAHFMGLKCLSYPTVRLPAPKPSRRSSTKAYVSDLSLYGKTYSTHVLDLSLYGKTYSTHAFGWGCRNIPAREDL